MKKRIRFVVLLFLTYVSLEVSAQIKKGDLHIGISGLPVLDFFNSYPDNKISGFGISGQIGFFPHKNIYLGINPYLVKVKNQFPEFGDITLENQKIYGVNTSMYYYGAITAKFYIYGGVSMGIGAADHHSSNGIAFLTRNATYPIFALAPVIGIQYFITNTVALNFNLPLLNIKYISYTSKDGFTTVAPTLGIGVFFH